MATGITMAQRLVDKTIRGLRFRNEARQHILQVSWDTFKTFEVRVEKPEVLALSIQKSCPVRIGLKRSGAFTADVEGIIKHVDSSGNTVYQRSYRSDQGGYEEEYSLSEGDTIIIVMEAYHFFNPVGQGSCEMELALKYLC